MGSGGEVESLQVGNGGGDSGERVWRAEDRRRESSGCEGSVSIRFRARTENDGNVSRLDGAVLSISASIAVAWLMAASAASALTTVVPQQVVHLTSMSPVRSLSSDVHPS